MAFRSHDYPLILSRIDCSLQVRFIRLDKGLTRRKITQRTTENVQEQQLTITRRNGVSLILRASGPLVIQNSLSNGKNHFRKLDGKSHGPVQGTTICCFDDDDRARQKSIFNFHDLLRNYKFELLEHCMENSRTSAVITCYNLKFLDNTLLKFRLEFNILIKFIIVQL